MSLLNRFTFPKISNLTQVRVTIRTNAIAYEMTFLDVPSASEALLLSDLLSECLVSWYRVACNTFRFPVEL